MDLIFELFWYLLRKITSACYRTKSIFYMSQDIVFVEISSQRRMLLQQPATNATTTNHHQPPPTMVPISLATQPAISQAALSAGAAAVKSAAPAFLLPTAVSVLRGGAKEAATAAFDLTRARIRLEGLSAYGVTTALLMNAAMRIYSSTPKKMQDLTRIEDEDAKKIAKVENWVTVMFAFLVTITILSGMYTTITFSLLALYSKTALGMSVDAQYLEFFKMTESIRQIGFETYIISLLCFKGSFVCSLFLTFKGKLRYWLSGFGALILAYSWYNIKTIMHFATTLLFK